MKKVRIAIVGAGARAMEAIFPAFSYLEDVEIVGVCDVDEQRCDAAAQMYNIPKKYGKNILDYRRMAEELAPDAMAIIGQPHIMYDLWEWTLKNKINLYIEKPLGLAIHQARSLAWMAENNDLITAVSFQRRWTPMVMKLRDECLKRGPIVHAVCRFYKPGPNPMTGARDHIMDDCVHSIDTLRWICGGNVTEIISHTKRVQTPDINFVSAALQFDNGAAAYLINSWVSGKRVFEVEMHAPGIYVTAEHEVGATLFADGDLKGVYYDTKEMAGSDKYHVYTGVVNAARSFVDGIKTHTLPDTCFQNSVESMRIADTILANDVLKYKA